MPATSASPKEVFASLGREGMGTSDGSTGILHKIVRAAGSLVSSIRTKIVLPYAVLTLAVAAVGTFVVTQLVAGSLEIGRAHV